MSGRRTHSLLLLSLLLWAGVLIGTADQVWKRLHYTVEARYAEDLLIFFRAAQHVRAGESPFLEEWYTYSPLVAWVFSIFSSEESALWWWTAGSLGAGLASVALVTATLWRHLSVWQRPLVAGVASITLFYSYITEASLKLGQTDLLVLMTTSATVFFASRSWTATSGVLVAVGALVKTWPAAFGLWFFRRGARGRWRSVSAAAGAVIVFCAAVLVMSGPGVFGEWWTRTVGFSSQPHLAYSVWGLGDFLFRDNGVVTPLIDSPILATAVSWAAAALVVACLIFALRFPGSDSFAMWHVTSAMILLLPVSHLSYRLLALPLLWVWCAHALRHPRLGSILVLGLLGVQWLFTARVRPVEEAPQEGALQFAIFMSLVLASLVMSVLMAPRVGARSDFTVASCLS